MITRTKYFSDSTLTSCQVCRKSCAFTRLRAVPFQSVESKFGRTGESEMLLPLKCVFVISVCAFLPSVFHDIIRTNEDSSQSFSLKWTIESNMHFKQVFKVYYAYIVFRLAPIRFVILRSDFRFRTAVSRRYWSFHNSFKARWNH